VFLHRHCHRLRRPRDRYDHRARQPRPFLTLDFFLHRLDGHERKSAVRRERSRCPAATGATATTTTGATAARPAAASTFAARNVVGPADVADWHAVFRRTGRRPHHELAVADLRREGVGHPLPIIR
jgi:hypothetical protein